MPDLQEQLKHVNAHARGFRRQAVHTFPINEAHHQEEIIDQLARPGTLRPTEGKAQLHAGVAGFFNFDMAAVAKSDGIILMDNNRNQIDFWRSIVPLIAACPTAADFREAFAARIKNGDWFRIADSIWSRSVPLRFRDVWPHQTPMPEDFFKDQGWLDVPEMYAHIHRLAKEGAIAAVLMDITDAAQCHRLKQAVGRLEIGGKEAELATLYASNVYDLQQMHPLRTLPYLIDSLRHASVPATKAVLEDELVGFLCEGKGPKEDPKWHKRKAAIHAAIGALYEVMVVNPPPPLKETQVGPDGKFDVELFSQELRERLLRYNGNGAQDLYQRLLDHPRLNDEVLVATGLVGPDAHQHVYNKVLTPKAMLSYTPLREMAEENTRIYCTSIRRRPLLVFEGAESPAASWRDKLRAEGVREMRTLRADDRIVGR